MSREVTVRVPLAASLDLLERPARACIGFVHDGQPQIAPVRLRFETGRFLIGVEPGPIVPDAPAEVVLVVDEGVMFFELRAVYVRGVASSLSEPGHEGLQWFEIEPSLTSSWDYGRMRSI